MKKALLSFILTSVILGVFTYCSKKDDPAPGYTPIEQQVTSVVGFVSPINQFDTYLTIKSDFIVSIVGEDFSSITDQYGKFAIANVKVGAYKIMISKNGFATLNYPFYVSSPGAGNQPNNQGAISIKEQSTLNITSVTSLINNCANPYPYFCDTVLQINAVIGSLPGYTLGSGTKSFIAFVGTDINVSKSNYLFTTQSNALPVSYTGTISDLGNYYGSKRINDLKASYGLSKGQKLYIVLHEYSGYLNANSYYYNSTNETTGLNEYPTINPIPSDITYVTLP